MPRLFLSCLLILAAIVLAACASDIPLAGSGANSPPTDDRPSDVPTPFQPVADTPTPTVLQIWLSPALPEPLRERAAQLQQVGGRSVVFVESLEQADVRLEPAAERPLSRWIYVLAAPFPTVRDAMSLEELRALWRGEGDGTVIMTSADGLAAGDHLLGAPGQGLVVEESQLVEQAWAARPAVALIPFERLEPRWKVIVVEVSPLDRGPLSGSYPLGIEFGLSGEPSLFDALAAALDWPATNRNPEQLSVVAMTGVTALTRATAWIMEAKGITYPADLVGEWLRDADVTHVSNEVSFTDACPAPDPSPANTRFCSKPAYAELLDAIGVDVVELTGNHNLDWGADAARFSTELYRARGWLYYGGGDTLEDSRQPAVIEHNGNTFVFLGCNAAGPPYALASAVGPGAAPCDMTYFLNEVTRFRQSGAMPIFTFQWPESYRYWPLPDQIAAFREVVDAGAVIVSGSQAHQPQGFEFYNGGFIHYGPGNLFFDQMWSTETRQEFIVRYIFYEGRHLSTVVHTALLEDWSQPRPMTDDERAAFLTTIFQASGW